MYRTAAQGLLLLRHNCQMCHSGIVLLTVVQQVTGKKAGRMSCKWVPPPPPPFQLLQSYIAKAKLYRWFWNWQYSGQEDLFPTCSRCCCRCSGSHSHSSIPTEVVMAQLNTEGAAIAAWNGSNNSNWKVLLLHSHMRKGLKGYASIPSTLSLETNLLTSVMLTFKTRVLFDCSMNYFPWLWRRRISAAFISIIIKVIIWLHFLLPNEQF